PYVWRMPSPVATVAAGREAAARAAGADGERLTALLPGFQLASRRDAAETIILRREPLKYWAPLLSVELRVQRLARRDLPGAARIFRAAEDLGELPAARIAPYVYEVVGVSSADAARIAALIRYRDAVLKAKGDDVLRKIFVVYADGGADAQTI